jgi:hypothetical protein
MAEWVPASGTFQGTPLQPDHCSGSRPIHSTPLQPGMHSDLHMTLLASSQLHWNSLGNCVNRRCPVVNWKSGWISKIRYRQECLCSPSRSWSPRSNRTSQARSFAHSKPAKRCSLPSPIHLQSPPSGFQLQHHWSQFRLRHLVPGLLLLQLPLLDNSPPQTSIGARLAACTHNLVRRQLAGTSTFSPTSRSPCGASQHPSEPRHSV